MNTPFFSLLRLESQFPRPLGDSANIATHAFPVSIEIIADATVERVVYQGAAGLIERFISAAQAQVKKGAVAVGTSCGFLFEHQATIQARLNVPFLSSSLLWLQASKGTSEPAAILTFDSDILSKAAWFRSVAPNAELEGLGKNSHLYRTIHDDALILDVDLASAEVVNCALALVRRYRTKFGYPPKTMLLECTNLGPYKAAIQMALEPSINPTIYDRGYRCTIIDYNDLMKQCWDAL